jgi:hypothetical protein
MEGANTAEDAFGYSSLAPSTVSTVERLAQLEPSGLATMHGPAHVGPGGTWLRELAESYAGRLDTAVAA